MTKEFAQKVVNVLHEMNICGDEGASVHKSYSGRGMFGQTTAGVVAGNAIDIGIAIGIVSEREMIDPPATQQDSMGLGIIVY